MHWTRKRDKKNSAWIHVKLVCCWLWVKYLRVPPWHATWTSENWCPPCLQRSVLVRGFERKLYETVSVHHQCIFNGKACSGLWHIWNLFLPKNWPARRFACLCRARRACEMLGRFPRRGAIHADLGAAGGSKNEKNELKPIEFIEDNIHKYWLRTIFGFVPAGMLFSNPKASNSQSHSPTLPWSNAWILNHLTIWIPPTHHSEHIVHANKTAEPVFFIYSDFEDILDEVNRQCLIYTYCTV